MSDNSVPVSPSGKPFKFKPPFCPSCNHQASKDAMNDAMRTATEGIPKSDDIQISHALKILQFTCANCNHTYNAKGQYGGKYSIRVTLGFVLWMTFLFGSIFAAAEFISDDDLVLLGASMVATLLGLYLFIKSIPAVPYAPTDEPLLASTPEGKEKLDKQVSKARKLQTISAILLTIVAIIQMLKFFF